jgi:hypothetical protein
MCSHCDSTAAVSDARNEKTSAGISADGACGRIQPLMRTARLRPTNDTEDIYLAGQFTCQAPMLLPAVVGWKVGCDGDSVLTDLAHHRAVGDTTLRLRPHVLLNLRGAINSKHAAGIRIMT